MGNEGRPGSIRQGSQGGYKHPLDRQFIEEREEEHFESAKGSLRGDSNFHSVIEYENSQYAMDGRINPLMLKKKGSEYYDPNSKGFAKAQTPTQFSGQSRTGMNSYQASPFNQMREAPQARIPSNRLIHIGGSSQPQMNSGMNQSVNMNSQISMNPSLHKISSNQGSPQNGIMQPHRASSFMQAKPHPMIEVVSNDLGPDKQQQGVPAVPGELGGRDSYADAAPDRPEEEDRHNKVGEGPDREGHHEDRVAGVHERADLDAAAPHRAARVQRPARQGRHRRRRRTQARLRHGHALHDLLQHPTPHEEALQPPAR